MSNELQTTGNNALSLQDMLASVREMAEISDQRAAEYETTYPLAYVNTVHPMSESEVPAGWLRVKFNREEELSAQVLAAWPVDMLGTSGFKDSRNPTPMNWKTDFNDKEALERYQWSMCKSSGNFEPDPMYRDRTLTHPDANNREFVKASPKYRGTEDDLIKIPLTNDIGKVQDCRQCVFGNDWFGAWDEENKTAPRVLRRVCQPSPAAIIYLTGMLGQGRLSEEQRTLAQITMNGQARRAAFASKKEENFLQLLGIPNAMDTVINAKSVDKTLPPYAVQVDNDLFFFPILIGGVVATMKDKQGNAKGKTVSPFAFNTAGVIRRYMSENVESDPQRRFAGAVQQAVAEFTSIIKPQDIASFKKQLLALLDATMPRLSIPESMALHEEFAQVNREYTHEGGKERITTPFQRVETAPEEEATEEDAPVVETVAETEDPTAILEGLKDAPSFFAAGPVEPELPEDDFEDDEDDDEDVFDFGSSWGDD